jgi:hypothetical protein
MNALSPGLLIFAVAAVGVLHTLVPDHWVPIALFARQRGWTRAHTARAAAIAGLGHTLSTLAIAAVVWFAGVALATRFGKLVDEASAVALIAFGLWIAIGSWRELHAEGHHGHFPYGPAQERREEKAGSRTALLLILGSSPMIEGIPAFFAASRFGVGLLAVMAIIFAAATVTTYVVLCVASASGMQQLRLGPLERYGEVLSGSLIALIGLIFLFVPKL